MVYFKNFELEVHLATVTYAFLLLAIRLGLSEPDGELSILLVLYIGLAAMALVVVAIGGRLDR